MIKEYILIEISTIIIIIMIINIIQYYESGIYQNKLVTY